MARTIRCTGEGRSRFIGPRRWPATRRQLQAGAGGAKSIARNRVEAGPPWGSAKPAPSRCRQSRVVPREHWHEVSTIRNADPVAFPGNRGEVADDDEIIVPVAPHVRQHRVVAILT